MAALCGGLDAQGATLRHVCDEQLDAITADALLKQPGLRSVKLIGSDTTTVWLI
jgi:hypothetical protein